jgi:hypothetical protein
MDADIGKRAGDFLQRCFKSAMYDPEGQGPDAVFSERIINPLIHALAFDAIKVGLFRNLHERLASDAFSRMTRYGTWLNDRKRAVGLIVIAGDGREEELRSGAAFRGGASFGRASVTTKRLSCGVESRWYKAGGGRTRICDPRSVILRGGCFGSVLQAQFLTDAIVAFVRQ